MAAPYGDWILSGLPMLTDRAFACLLIAALLLAGAAREIVSASRRSADAVARPGDDDRATGHHPVEPGTPLNGPTTSLVIQPP